MEIWLDTLDSERIRTAAIQGILHGITTNPSLLANTPLSPQEALRQLLTLQQGPVAVQVVANTTEGMIEQAARLRELSERFVIKIPVTPPGLAAIRCLKTDHIPIMATAIFHPNQVLLAARAGADYAAPYLKRMAAYGQEAFEDLAMMQQIIDDYHFPTKLIAASITDMQAIRHCLALRIAAITMPAELYDKFAAPHPHSAEAVKLFEKDWGERDF